MEQAKVAGIVILNQKDGRKKFLVRKSNDQTDVVKTTIDKQFTSLACILNKLNRSAHLDTTNMELVELTNIDVSDEKMPLFVFSLEEEDGTVEPLEEGLIWEEPSELRGMLQNFQISGVPIFK